MPRKRFPDMVRNDLKLGTGGRALVIIVDKPCGATPSRRARLWDLVKPTGLPSSRTPVPIQGPLPLCELY